MGKVIITNKEIYNDFIRNELDVKRLEGGGKKYIVPSTDD